METKEDKDALAVINYYSISYLHFDSTIVTSFISFFVVKKDSICNIDMHASNTILLTGMS